MRQSVQEVRVLSLFDRIRLFSETGSAIEYIGHVRWFVTPTFAQDEIVDKITEPRNEDDSRALPFFSELQSSTGSLFQYNRTGVPAQMSLCIVFASGFSQRNQLVVLRSEVCNSDDNLACHTLYALWAASTGIVFDLKGEVEYGQTESGAREAVAPKSKKHHQPTIRLVILLFVRFAWDGNEQAYKGGPDSRTDYLPFFDEGVESGSTPARTKNRAMTVCKVALASRVV